MAKKPRTLSDLMAPWPPPLVLAMANRSSKARVKEAAKAAGIPYRTFKRIAVSKSWKDVKFWQASAFCAGCGFDPIHQTKPKAYLMSTLSRRHPLPHLTQKQLHSLSQTLVEAASQNRSKQAST